MSEMLYSLNRVFGFTRDQFMRLLRTHYNDLGHLDRGMPGFDKTPDGQWLVKNWDNVKPYTIHDRSEFAHDRKLLRVFFWALRPDRFFRQLDHKVVDSVEVEVPRKIFDKFGNAREVKAKRRYELLQVLAEDIGVTGERGAGYVYALEVTCPTSGSKFVIIVGAPDTWRGSSDPTVAAALRFLYGNDQLAARHGDVLIKKVEVKNSYLGSGNKFASTVSMPESWDAEEIIKHVSLES